MSKRKVIVPLTAKHAAYVRYLLANDKHDDLPALSVSVSTGLKGIMHITLYGVDADKTNDLLITLIRKLSKFGVVPYRATYDARRDVVIASAFLIENEVRYPDDFDPGDWRHKPPASAFFDKQNDVPSESSVERWKRREIRLRKAGNAHRRITERNGRPLF